MAEFIDREAARDLLDIALDDDWEIEYANDRLDEIPAADVRPVVRGEWRQTKDEFGIYNKCSVCGKEYYCGPIAPFNFCPNCGADMREES
jgi:hypothetical protein